MITAETPSVAALWYTILGGQFRLRMVQDNGIGHRWANVLDAEGNCIGQADDFIYGASGWAVHTAPFAGFVPNSQIVFDDARLHQQTLFPEPTDGGTYAESGTVDSR